MSVYLKGNDPDWVVIPLDITNAKICDLRDTDTCATLNISPEIPSIPWVPQRAQCIPASSWQASNTVRKTNADDMIYTCRRAPRLRWHIVLFLWNQTRGAQVKLAGDLQEFGTF